MLTPLGCGVGVYGIDYWWGLDEKYYKVDASDFATSYACEIPFGVDEKGQFNPDEWMSSKKDVRLMILFYMAFVPEQAVKDAGWTPEETDLLRTGVMMI